MTKIINENERKRIGTRIAEIRKNKGMTQMDLSAATGIQQAHIARIETGRYSVGLDTLALIAKALDAKVDIIVKSEE